MTRGEYRSFHTVLLDGPDFQRLTPEARWLYVVCRLSVGASGIDVVPGMMAALQERSGYPANVVGPALTELVAGGWIETDGSVLWVVRGLEFEPSLRAGNAGHRKALRQHLAGLPSRPILARFSDRYRAWLVEGDGSGDGRGDATPVPSDSHPDGSRVKGEGEGIGSRERDEGMATHDDGLPVEVRESLTGYLRAARFPEALVRSVALLLNPEASPHYPPGMVAESLREMQAAGRDFNATSLARWCANKAKRPREEIVTETDECGVMCRWRVEPDGTKTKLGRAA